MYDRGCVKGRTMSTKVAFSWRCPKGHSVDDSFSKAELKGRLEAGRLTAVCPHCGGQEYVVPAEQLKRILKELSTH
jgi:Zn finger protein HypA/HybF involved in hydrogenase expression